MDIFFTAEERRRQINTSNEFVEKMPKYYAGYKDKLNKYNLDLIRGINGLMMDMKVLKMLFLILVYELHKFNDKDASIHVNCGWTNIKSLNKQKGFFATLKTSLKEYGVPSEKVYTIIKKDIKRTEERVSRLSLIIIRNYTSLFWLEDYCLLLEENGNTIWEDFKEFYDSHESEFSKYFQKDMVFEGYDNVWINHIADEYFAYAKAQMKEYGRTSELGNELSLFARDTAEIKRYQRQKSQEEKNVEKATEILSATDQAKKECYEEINQIENALRSKIANQFADSDFIKAMCGRGVRVGYEYAERIAMAVIYKTNKHGDCRYSWFCRRNKKGELEKTKRGKDIKIFNTTEEKEQIAEIVQEFKNKSNVLDVRLVRFSAS